MRFDAPVGLGEKRTSVGGSTGDEGAANRRAAALAALAGVGQGTSTGGGVQKSAGEGLEEGGGVGSWAGFGGDAKKRLSAK